MLRSINKDYVIFSTLVYALIASLFFIDLKIIYLFNYFSIITFAVAIQYLREQPAAYFTTPRLRFAVFYYTFFFALCYNLISYYYTGNLYVFSEDDAVTYNNEAQHISNLTLFDAIAYFLNYEMEDVGIIIVLGLLYKVAASKIMLNLFYIAVSIITAGSLFGIGRRFMPGKYAFLCAVAYSFSSYVIWFHSSGLKESLLIMLIVSFYSNYYKVTLDKKMISIWGLILMPLLMLLFRPVLAIFCVASIVLGIVLKRKLNMPQVLLLLTVVGSSFYFLETILHSTDKFLLGGTETMLEAKEVEGMVKGGVAFTYMVNTLSSFFGPFPTLSSSKVHLSFYAPGLIFKILLSVPFWFGVIYIVRKKVYALYPILLFIFFEIVSLTYILEALELRKSMPHFALIFVVAFYFISKFDNRQLASLKQHLFYKKTFNIAMLVLCLLMVYWNFR